MRAQQVVYARRCSFFLKNSIFWFHQFKMVQKTGYEKLKNLRHLIENLPSHDQKNFQAYIITSDDAHHSEYIQDRDQRREYISGFKGSAGTVVVTLNHALLWTDGRYFAQAKLELDPPDAWTLMKEGIPDTPSIEEWLIENLPANSLIGADPNLISNSDWVRIENSLKTTELTLFPVEKNLVDIVWGLETPPATRNNIVPQEIIYSGRTAGEKVNECFEKMEKKEVSILVLTALDDVAYLLNLRGSDIPYNPVFFAYAILFSNKVHLFVDQDKLSQKAREQLEKEKVDFVCHPYETVQQFLGEILNTCKKKVWLSHTANHALHMLCSSSAKYVSITPVSLMKLVKNEIEIKGMKQAHIWDGVALVKYFSWLEENVDKHRITEISGAEQLEIFRKEEEKYIGPSFSTISGAGKHGAIIHYKPSVQSDIPINSQELYLCDSGAHFPDGTTDVTRTLHFGQPSAYEKECFTRVLKGQLQLAMSRFPAKIKGNYLDTLARKYLWDVGLDYLHGTGHGVGAYLNVHEFPTMISWKPYPDDPGLQDGMFLSNEPGYYEDGNFGIRLENIELVVNATTKYHQPNRKFLTFETVTMVPIQTKMIDTSMLTNEEIQFLNNYHKKVYEILHPYLQDPRHITALNWLQKETQPL